MARRCITVVSCSWLILILIQGHVCASKTNKRKEVDVEINRDGVVKANIDGKEGYCEWSAVDHNWKVMNVICRQLQRGPPEWIDRRRDQYRPYDFYYRFGDDRPKPGRGRRIGQNTTYYYQFICNGNETGLAECSIKSHTGGIFGDDYILSRCLPATSQDLKIHLMMESRYLIDLEGTIVTYVNGIWGPICTNYQNLSSVVCPMFAKDIVHRPKNLTHNKIQYSYADPVLFIHACDGAEANLSQCDIETNMSTRISCHASSYAYVECVKVYPPYVPYKRNEGLSDKQLLGIAAIFPCLILCSSTICFKKASRVRKRLDDDDDDDDSEIIDPNMTVDEARLRVVRKFF